ncbi:MAG: hypothetical protein NZ775_02790 [Gammaproteobacteria bacterium]|nr:hypothetical protein [Gammaproteobacteria bacterium]
MSNKQSLMSILFLLAYSVTAHANWPQEIIQTANVQFLDFSVQDNVDPFAIKIEQQPTPINSEQVVVINNSNNGLDPILAWAQYYVRPTMSSGFGSHYPMVIYYPIPIYYPVFYPIYTPYYFN